ncbi:MAG: UbiA family prenyltransferase [Calditrichaeota bacterium]|nr:UbiA family prenyltransferase [Calditrichota bacterium]
MKSLAKPFDYIFILRPVLFYPVWTVFLAGALSVGMAPQGHGWPLFKLDAFHGAWGDLGWALLSYSLLMGTVFILNQLTDVGSDKRNSKLFLIADEHISAKAAVREGILILVLGLLAGLKTSGWFLGVWVLSLLILGVGYSLPPFLWKDHPIRGLVTNLLGGLLTFFAGWLSVGSPSVAMVFHALPYIFAVGSVYFLTTILDAKGDLHSHKITFAVRYGKQTTIRMAILFDSIALVLGFLTRDWIVFIPALLSYFLFVFLIFKNDNLWLNRITRLPILLLSLMVAVYFPIYFAGILGIFLVSKWYYHVRFGLNYPSLNPSYGEKEVL